MAAMSGNDGNLDTQSNGRGPSVAILKRLRIGVARLVERLFGISIVLARSLALLARFRAAALLLTGFLTRRLILLAGLVLVHHVVSFHGNTTITTARSPRRSDKGKWQFALLPRSA
jgi:hypothetical protein